MLVFEAFGLNTTMPTINDRPKRVWTRRELGELTHSFYAVGVAEIAELLDVESNTVGKWLQRSRQGPRTKPFPKPLPWTISKYAAWNWADIYEWAEQTNRLPEE